MSRPDFPADFLDRLDDAVRARDGTAEHGEVRFRCPAEGHPDEHPSARWNREKAVWCCDACGASGGALHLADKLGVEKPQADGCTLNDYAAAKRLPVAFLRSIGLSDFHHSGARCPVVAMPYLNDDGTNGATHYRKRLTSSSGTGDRFLWKRGAKAMLYGRDRRELALEAGYVVLVEGESDCHTLWHHGVPAIGLPGAGQWKDSRDAEWFDGIGRVYVLIEPDQGGATLRGHLKASNIRDRVWIIHPPAGVKDWSALHLADSAGFRPAWEGLRSGATSLAADAAAAAASVVGGDLLDAVHRFLGRFVAYPSEDARIAHALWVAHAHLMDAWESTPRIAFLSPEPASGKTRALEVTELLVPNPVEAVNVSAAYLFRKVGDEGGRPTLLYDEIDTVFGPKAKDNEDIRGLLNAGHRRGAIAGRCVVRGKAVETVDYPAYCAVALAGLGDLPDTILTRSVIVKMRRRAPGERVESYRRRVHGKGGHELRDQLATWANTVRAAVTDAWPEMPDGIEDRDADVWEALLAVADAAGGDWPARARVTAVTLVTDSRESAPSLGIRLLTDLRTVFGDDDVMFTDAILTALHTLDESPWSEIGKPPKPLNARGLARRLNAYGVKSKTVRDGDATRKGYTREDLADAWSRYLPPISAESDTSDTSDTTHATTGQSSDPESDTSATGSPDANGDIADVADFWGDEDDAEDDAESTNGHRRVCVHCGDPLPDDWSALYCEQHGGAATARGLRCVDCGDPLPPGRSYRCEGCVEAVAS